MKVAPVAVLRTGNRIHRRKYVLVFPDSDEAAQDGMLHSQHQLGSIMARFSTFDYHGLVRDDG
jgi:hypothetical protein